MGPAITCFSPIQRPAAWLLVVVVFLSFVSSARAQQSRAEELAAEQAAKSTRLTPNVPTRAERTLEWFEDYFSNPNTVYLTFGGIYPSGGFAPGIAWRRAVGHARLNLGGAWSLRNYKLGHASVRFPELAGERIAVDTHVRWVDATQVPFYGLGNVSQPEDRGNYGLRSTNIGGSVAYKPVRWFTATGGVAARLQRTREGLGARPSIERLHSPPAAPGLFTEQTYTQWTAGAGVDWRESPGYTRSGGLYSVTFNDFRDQDDEFSFRQVDADVRQFIPILKEHWVIGLRALVTTTNSDPGQVIPFYMLPSLGGNSSVRAYSDFRFHDKHLMLLSAEYRWIPSRILDMALFVDAGKVAAERRDLDLDGLKTAYGIGARFHGPNFTPLRIDVAHGREGFRVHFTGNVPF